MSSNLPLTQALYNLQEQQAIQLQQQHDALIREVQQAQVSLLNYKLCCFVTKKRKENLRAILKNCLEYSRHSM